MVEEGRDITNKTVRNISMMEFLGGLVAVSVAYGVLTTNVSALDSSVATFSNQHKQDIHEIRAEQKAVTKDIGTIKADMRIMRQAQDFHAKALNKTSNTQGEILKNQQKLLRLLER